MKHRYNLQPVQLYADQLKNRLIATKTDDRNYLIHIEKIRMILYSRVTRKIMS